jgi:hypothetical protein
VLEIVMAQVKMAQWRSLGLVPMRLLLNLVSILRELGRD